MNTLFLYQSQLLHLVWHRRYGVGLRVNVSRIKATKSTYSDCKGSKTTHKKVMNEYWEAKKEAGTYEAAQESECGIETAEERAVRKSHQAVAKRAQPCSFEGGSSW